MNSEPTQTGGTALAVPRPADESGARSGPDAGGLTRRPQAGERPVRRGQTRPGAQVARSCGADLPEKVRQRAGEMPASLRPLYLRVMAGRRASPRAAIKSFCQMCVGWEDYRAGVRGCTDPACPLYRFRPYREAEG